MPAFLAHCICGMMSLHGLRDGRLKSAVAAHPGVYHIGLAGPDLFFYSPSELLRPGMITGRIMHKYRTGLFLRKLFGQAMAQNGENRQIALAYFAGFLGHYSLDVHTHAMVYRTCHDPNDLKALGKHFRFEAAMDDMCCEKICHRHIHDMGQTRLVHISGTERRIVAQILKDTLGSAYPDLGRNYSVLRLRCLLAEYEIITYLLADRTGFKEWLMLGAERLFLHYPLLSPLFINQNRYGLGDKNFRKFLRCFRNGLRLNKNLLAALDEALEADPEKIRLLFEMIGSKSYHGSEHEKASMMEKQW